MAVGTRIDSPALAPDAPIPEPWALERPRTRILLVDDDKRNLLALSEVLDDIAEVVCAASGEEALRYLLKEQFAVIVLDVLMPGLDGYETAGLIRKREMSRDTPIIFLTAINKEDAHLLRGYDSGAVDYVFKPVEPRIIRSKVSVFVSLYEKTRAVERNAIIEQRLLRDKIDAQQERVHAIEALRQSEERQALILGALPLAVYVQDASADRVSPQFVSGDIEAITGFALDDFRHDPSLWAARIDPDDKDLADISGARSVEYRWRHADGSTRYLLDQSVVLPGRGGAVAGTIRDVTEQHRLQDQLLQARKLDAVGQLTGGIAHDFNNLLASVLSGLSLIERRAELNERAVQVLDMTRHAAEQGKHLVDRMLAFSRRQNLKPQAVSLAAVSGTIDALLAPVLGGLVKLNWEIEDDLPSVFIDPSQLELALMNLVINARDAMPAGGTITIRLDGRTRPDSIPDLAAGDYVVVTVADTGTGIPPQLLPQVIEPFFTTKEVGKGTGLGLSTAYGFTRQSGGTLTIESPVGQGTRVAMWLPASDLAPVEPASPVPEPLESMAEVPAEDVAVLLVDDSASLRAFTEMQLSDEGYRVVCAAGGAEALAMVERNAARYDIIVTDFAMPMISGLDVIRYARSVRPDWPAVIITGYAETDAMASRPGNVPLVTKPFTKDRLLAAMRAALQGTDPG